MKRVLLPSLFILLLFSSCVHHSPFVEEYYFQALGEKGEIVVTCDAEKIKSGELDSVVGESLKSDSLMKKADRITLSLIPDDEDYTLSGALEGDISSFWTNSGLSVSSSFEKEKDGETRWYSGNGASVYSPENGILLFTEGSYSDFYTRSYSDRIKMIDDITAGKMAGSALSLYVFGPERLLDIGFEIPQTVLSEIVMACLLLDGDGDELVLSGTFLMSGESGARALNTLLRNQVIQEKRRSGEKLDTLSLASVFSYSGNAVKISGYVLSQEMKQKTGNMISERIGGII